MATLTVDYYMGLEAEISDDQITDICMDIAQQCYKDWGLDPEEDESAFDEFRYDIIEPALINALENSLSSAMSRFPQNGGAWVDYMPENGTMI